MIVGNFLFIRKGIILEYLKIFSYDSKGERILFENMEDKASLIYLIIDEKSKICRIMTVAES